MSFRFIESYATTEATAEIVTRTYPVPCLVEDDDGIRMLVVENPTYLMANVWHQAGAAGASALIYVHERGWLWMTSEHFIDGRTEAPVTQSYVFPDGWSGPDEPLTYLQMRAATEQAEAEHQEQVQQAQRGRFVHLHAHSEFSPLDGMSTLGEMVREVVADGQGALALTDHSGCAGHPDLQFACEGAGIQPIFGIEANFTDDRHRRGVESVNEDGRKVTDAREVLGNYTHLVLWAMDDDGLRNLWGASTEANRTGFYGRPRMDWEVLEQYSEGLMASTACLRGPLAQHLLAGDQEKARSVLARLMGIFPDRLYVEIHTNTLPEQIRLNHMLVALAQEYGLPLIAAVDSHYPCKQDGSTHQAWIAAQTNKDVQDDADLFAGDQHYHLATEAEVRQALAYLGPQVVDQAVENTGKVAQRCTARIHGTPTAPVYSKQGGAQRDVERLVDLCLGNWRKTQGKRESEAVYMARFEREMRLLIDKGFCGYFLMVADYCRAARAAGILVGPGRGSGGGSLVAYLCDIVEIDAVDADLLFERFMTEGRTELPDFDVDFPASKRPWITNYIVDKYGEDYVVRVGTHIRLKNKGVIRDLARVLKTTIDIDYKDIDAVSKIIDEAESDKAGLGMAWEDLWAQHEEALAPYRAKYPLMFDLADKMVGRLKAYGKHAAGLVITTGDEPLTGRLPMRLAGDDLVAEFDMNALAKMGLVKFDILTLRNLDTIQMAVDLVKEQRGIEVNVYDWLQEYEDPQVWAEISDGHTMGIFQIETRSGTKMARQFKPQSLHELADVITLVRPGPKNSGLTDTYLRRRAGAEMVTVPDPRLEEVLGKTFGCIVYQEDLMAVTMVLAGYDGVEADEVRSILGKKKVEKIPAAGRKFISQSVERGMGEDGASRLWEQMAEFAKYCVSGDTQVHLAGSGRRGGGTVSAEMLYRRINTPLLDPVVGKTRRGEEYSGPCVVCGVTEAPKWQRGACQACYVWRQKFRDVRRGLYGLTVEADGRIRPCRILMVHQHQPEQTWTVTLSDGRSITATGNHRHLTPEGLRRVDELSVGDSLVADGGYEKHRYLHGEQRTTVGDRLLVGAVNGATGPSNHGYVDGGFASLMMWTAQAPDCCQECGHDGSRHRLERAHLDGNHANNDWSNLAMLCVSCHKKHDYAVNGRRRRWGKGRLTESVQIVSIEPRAVEPVYSVVMDDPHIWIANGIATANSFNRAHAFGYGVLGYWTAWLKFHYPVQFLAAVLSTVDKDRIPDFVNEARRMGYSVLPPDINESGIGFTAAPLAVRYGLDKVKGIGESGVRGVLEGQPYTSFEDFLERKGGGAHSGVVKTLAEVGAFDTLFPNRKALEARLEYEAGAANVCVFKDPAKVPLPCGFDWATEKNPPLIKQKGVMVPKPPPKRCTKACRNFTPATFDPAALLPYTDEEIRQKEMDLLGIHLTGNPFDRLPEDTLDKVATADEVETGAEGSYIIAAVVKTKRKHVTKTGKDMGFIGLFAQNGDLDVTVFSDEWAKYHLDLQPNRLCLAEVRKNDRGLTLSEYAPL